MWTILTSCRIKIAKSMAKHLKKENKKCIVVPAINETATAQQ
jgi:hypothetical protein